MQFHSPGVGVQSSKKHVAGHLDFPATALNNWKRKLTKNLICFACLQKSESEREKSSKRTRGDEDSEGIYLKASVAHRRPIKINETLDFTVVDPCAHFCRHSETHYLY